MKISFTLCFIIIGLAIICYLLFFKKKKSLKVNILFAFSTCVIMIAILVFPLLEYNNLYVKAFASFIYALRCSGMGQDLKVLSKIDLTTSIGYCYFVLMNILFLLAPLLTASFIITYLEKIVTNIKFQLAKNKNLYVFSEVNYKSLTLARSLQNNQDSLVIFTNVKDKKDINIKSIRINKEITNITFNPKSKITFYMISEYEEKNLNETLELIDKYKNRINTKIYVVNNNSETPVILDSIDKGEITVEIINETERAIFNLLNNKPLFLNAINKTIDILIVGCGNIGKEFLIDSLWCGIIPGYQLHIIVLDINADKIKENIIVEMPELLNNYDVTFVNEDIKSHKAIEFIKTKSDINYILVSMDNDNKNLDVAIMLRRLFLREFNRQPIINLYIENEFKKEEILRLSNEKGYAYNLNAFGSIKELYSKNNVFDSELEKLAIQIHLAYDSDDINLKRYNLREYNKRSSRATSLHIKYKLYGILKDRYTNDMQKDLELFRKMYSKEVSELLIKNEHDRWMAYMRSIGYIFVSTKEVARYYEKNKHYIHYLAKRHPALVEFHELDNVSKELSEITKENINLKESDEKIIRFLYEKIKL